MSNIFEDYIDDTRSSQSEGFNFGINTLRIDKIEFKKGSFGAQVVFTFKKNDTQNFLFFSLEPGRTVYHKNISYEKGDKKYPLALEEFNRKQMATLVHITKAYGVTEDKIKTAIAKKKPKNLEQYAKTVLGLLPKNYKEIYLDGFFMYQWSIKGKRDRTYLELGPNMGKGHFLSPHVEPVGGKWHKVKTEGKKEFHWEDEEGNIHPIRKSQWIMEKPEVNNQQTLEEDLPQENGGEDKEEDDTAVLSVPEVEEDVENELPFGDPDEVSDDDEEDSINF